MHSSLNKAYWNYINGLLDPEQDRSNKNFWKYVKSKRQDSFGVGSLKANGKVGIDPRSKADMLNNQFSSVFTKENKSNMPFKGNSPHPSSSNNNVSPAGIAKLLSNLNSPPPWPSG